MSYSREKELEFAEDVIRIDYEIETEREKLKKLAKALKSKNYNTKVSAQHKKKTLVLNIIYLELARQKLIDAYFEDRDSETQKVS